VAGDTLDEDIGVAVEFEGEDEEEDSEGDEVVVRPLLHGTQLCAGCCSALKPFG
jgi:hypothetical protein